MVVMIFEDDDMGTAKVMQPDDIKCTLSFTMRLSEWKQIKKTLSSNSHYAELQVMNEISDLVCQLEKTFYSDTES